VHFAVCRLPGVYDFATGKLVMHMSLSPLGLAWRERGDVVVVVVVVVHLQHLQTVGPQGLRLDPLGGDAARSYAGTSLVPVLPVCRVAGLLCNNCNTCNMRHTTDVCLGIGASVCGLVGFARASEIDAAMIGRFDIRACVL